MTLIQLALYVNLDVDDSFSDVEIARWFNKGIAQYNLIPPVTTYPFVELILKGSNTDSKIYLDVDYPLDDTFMVGVMLPYINSSVRSQDSSLPEKQMFMSEFITSASRYKPQSNVPFTYIKDKKNTELEIYQLGDSVYVSDMTRSPFTNNWSAHSAYAEVAQSVVVVFYDGNGQNKKTATLASGQKLIQFMLEAGVSATIYPTVDLTAGTEISNQTIITANAVYYYG